MRFTSNDGMWEMEKVSADMQLIIEADIDSEGKTYNHFSKSDSGRRQYAYIRHNEAMTRLIDRCDAEFGRYRYSIHAVKEYLVSNRTGIRCSPYNPRGEY